MDKRLSEKVIQNFDFKTMEVLKEYIQYRKDSIHLYMETANDPEEFRKLQGSIQELKYLEKIRDNAVSVTERDR
jgi:hypothetical protein